ncbi:MAG: CBS domain-containing protein [Pyrinomonadaceae bacterium]
MFVKDIMTGNPACCMKESSLEDAAKMMKENDCGCIPVVNEMETKTPVGVITDRDICCRTVAEGLNPLELKVGDIMISGVEVVQPNTSVEDCCNLMEEKQIRRVVVVDDMGSCCGIVSQADIAINAEENKTAEVVQEVSKSAAAQ